MKVKSFFIGILFLTVSGVLVHNAYSCTLPPVAIASPDSQIKELNATAYFDGSGSYDPDGGSTEITAYSWSFGSGAYDITGANTATPSCKYNTTGIKTVTLTVTDNDVNEGHPHNHTDSDTCLVKVLKIEITDPNYNPATKKHFTFNSASPGVCNVTATGTSGVDTENPNLDWTLTAIANSNQTSSPSPAKGAGPTFTYTTLPTSNGQFGDKTLTLSHPSVASTDNEIVQIFFMRDEKNHPAPDAGATPNWYYYWKRGGVVSLLQNVVYSDTTAYDYGYCDPFTGTPYICKHAPDYSCTEIEVTNKNNSALKFKVGYKDCTGGVLAVAVCCAHELRHSYDYNADPGSFLRGTDTDSDYLSDNYEQNVLTQYQFSPTDSDTYNMGIKWAAVYHDTGDLEFLACLAMQSPGNVNYSADWAHPGSQWP